MSSTRPLSTPSAAGATTRRSRTGSPWRARACRCASASRSQRGRDEDRDAPAASVRAARAARRAAAAGAVRGGDGRARRGVERGEGCGGQSGRRGGRGGRGDRREGGGGRRADRSNRTGREAGREGRGGGRVRRRGGQARQAGRRGAGRPREAAARARRARGALPRAQARLPLPRGGGQGRRFGQARRWSGLARAARHEADEPLRAGAHLPTPGLPRLLQGGLQGRPRGLREGPGGGGPADQGREPDPLQHRAAPRLEPAVEGDPRRARPLGALRRGARPPRALSARRRLPPAGPDRRLAREHEEGGGARARAAGELAQPARRALHHEGGLPERDESRRAPGRAQSGEASVLGSARPDLRCAGALPACAGRAAARVPPGSLDRGQGAAAPGALEPAAADPLPGGGRPRGGAHGRDDHARRRGARAPREQLDRGPGIRPLARAPRGGCQALQGREPLRAPGPGVHAAREVEGGDGDAPAGHREGGRPGSRQRTAPARHQPLQRAASRPGALRLRARPRARVDPRGRGALDHPPRRRQRAGLMPRRPGARPGMARGRAGGLPCGALAALAFALGCASAGPAPKPTTVLAGNPAQTILILPLNVPAVMPPELDAASPAVWAELETYLRAEGKELKTVAFPAARQLWLAAIHRVRAAEKGANAEKGGGAQKGGGAEKGGSAEKGSKGFDDAAREFVLEIARHAPFDRLIFPSLFAREARIDGSNARWDSVERPVEFEMERRSSKKGSAPPAVEGVAPAASLHAAVFDAKGNKVQEEVRGIDLLVRVHVAEASSSAEAPPSFEYTRRADPFENRAHVRDAIAHVLAPFLPPLPQAP